MSRITVIGAGFGALTSIKELRKRDKQVEITLIAPRAEFIYMPSLIWIPSGIRKGDDLRIDLQAFFKHHKVRFHPASVTGLKNDGRIVETDNGDMENDGLIIASGGRFIKKLPGIEHAILICEGIKAAERLRDRLKNMEGGTIALGFSGNPKEPSAVRGGPLFEILFGLDNQLRKEGRRDKFKLVFFNPMEKPGIRLGEKAVAGILKEMNKCGIETHLGYKPKRFEAGKVITEGGEINSDMIVFMPGMTGPAWLPESKLPMSDGGMLKADQHCKVESSERVYVVGDTGSYPGPAWAPKQAHMADLQAAAAVANLLSELKGEKAEATFRWELICIIDTLKHGIFVYRDHKRAIILPKSRLFHWAKRFFEGKYLSAYRR
ncbi:MAG: FAD-dependent oxidoreductase [Proteobacteria bacterium]|nr:FAD-dependent oxidoreductase [Pseudomonadota bacterium]